MRLPTTPNRGGSFPVSLLGLQLHSVTGRCMRICPGCHSVVLVVVDGHHVIIAIAVNDTLHDTHVSLAVVHTVVVVRSPLIKMVTVTGASSLNSL